MTGIKRSSKLFIFDSRQCLYFVYRGPGAWNSANTISFIGADGSEAADVVRQVDEKFRLTTDAGDWSIMGTVHNPANREINTIWRFARPVDSLLFLPAAYGGLLCLKPSAIWAFESMLSPAASSIMRAMPQLFERR